MKTNTLYPPGPWMIQSEHRKAMQIISRGLPVATVRAHPHGDTEATAQLLAAAPDMFRVLVELTERILAYPGPSQDSLILSGVWADVFAAVKKVRGEK